MVEAGYTTKLCKPCRGAGSLFAILIIVALIVFVYVFLFV